MYIAIDSGAAAIVAVLYIHIVVNPIYTLYMCYAWLRVILG